MTPRNPTNSDLLTEIKSIKTLQMTQGKDISMLKDWKHDVELIEKTVEKTRQKYAHDKAEKSKMDVFQALLPFIVALTALAYAILTYVGRIK